MTQVYKISGMGCGGCVARVQKALLSIDGITIAEVQLQSEQAVVTMQKPVPIEKLQWMLHKVGHYTIRKHR